MHAHRDRHPPKKYKLNTVTKPKFETSTNQCSKQNKDQHYLQNNQLLSAPLTGFAYFRAGQPFQKPIMCNKSVPPGLPLMFYEAIFWTKLYNKGLKMMCAYENF